MIGCFYNTFIGEQYKVPSYAHSNVTMMVGYDNVCLISIIFTLTDG